MDKKLMIKSTLIPLELNDGSTVDLTLNFARQLVVRSKKQEVYERHSKAVMLGCKDIFDYITGLYVAYLCAADDLDNAMTEQEFLQMAPESYTYIVTVYGELIEPKKAKASEAHSAEQQKQGSGK